MRVKDEVAIGALNRKSAVGIAGGKSLGGNKLIALNGIVGQGVGCGSLFLGLLGFGALSVGLESRPPVVG